MFRKKLACYGRQQIWTGRLTRHHYGLNSKSNNRRLLQHRHKHLQLFGPYAQQQQHQQQQRYFSDKLLGHSPMAPTSSTQSNSEESGIPTARDVEIAGGIWNPTSAKRDRLAELKVELTEDQYTLDDAATDQQIRDLFLADGIQWIVHTADTCRGTTSGISTTNNTAASTQLPSQLDPSQWDVEPTIAEVQNWIQEQENTIKSTTDGGMLNQQQWETYLEETIQKIDEQMVTLPSGRYLRRVRDFYTVPDDIINKDSSGSSSSKEEEEEEEDAAASMTKQQVQAILNDKIATTSEQQQLQSIGNKCLARYRLQLTRATCEYMIESWGTLTTLTDEALDRLAVKNDTTTATESSSIDNNSKDDDDGRTLTTLSLDKANKILQSCLVGDATDRFDSWWGMLDHNGDGLLEKTDMETAATSTVTPVQNAIVILYEEALEASPVLMRKGKVQETEAEEGEEDTTTTTTNNIPPKIKPKANPGWLERRREAKAKKRLLSTFQRATKKHFLDEVEMPHRLRCIYAWANKEHQKNKIDSVLIEASGWSGRKRYVELQPKISLPEFREVQEIHFTHLDRIGWEITKSFREDLLVEQGKGRQNAELRRDCMIFLLVVSFIDYGILIL